MTGASGFAGSHLLQHLARDSFRLTAEAASESMASGFSRTIDLVAWARSAPPAELAGLAQWDVVDLLDRDRVRQAIADLRPARVFHCAGAAHVGDSWARTVDTLSANVLVTHYLFDAIRRAGIDCRLLVPGSAHVYAPSTQPIAEDARLAPASPYAISKLAQEQLGMQAVAHDGVK
ncbi:MAG TPA: NAD-dependent epimerase/dehydratase family protein, partial [Vicinamibacterales bacterium]